MKYNRQEPEDYYEPEGGCYEVWAALHEALALAEQRKPKHLARNVPMNMNRPARRVMRSVNRNR